MRVFPLLLLIVSLFLGSARAMAACTAVTLAPAGAFVSLGFTGEGNTRVVWVQTPYGSDYCSCGVPPFDGSGCTGFLTAVCSANGISVLAPKRFETFWYYATDSQTTVIRPGVTSRTNLCSTEARTYVPPAPQASAVAKLAGSWIDNIGQSIEIFQNGLYLTYSYAGAGNYSGRFATESEVIFFGETVSGAVDCRGASVSWSNGVVFERRDFSTLVPQLAGVWADNNGNTVGIGQTGTRLSYLYNGRDTYTGEFVAASRVTFDGYPITGTIDCAGTTLRWSNGIVFRKAPPAATVPDLSGQWTDGAGNAIAVQQMGVSLAYVYNGSTSYAGTFASTSEITLTGYPIIGNVDCWRGTITWSNGVVFRRAASPETVPQLAGSWTDNRGTVIQLSQTGTGLTYLYPGNVPYTGRFSSVSRLSFDGYPIFGEVGCRADTITWSNGIVFRKSP